MDVPFALLCFVEFPGYQTSMPSQDGFGTYDPPDFCKTLTIFNFVVSMQPLGFQIVPLLDPTASAIPPWKASVRGRSGSSVSQGDPAPQIRIAVTLHYCNAESMSTVVQINSRGTFTIPKELRTKYGLDRQAILEETADGLILRPAATYPVEIYSAERLAEFQRMNEDGLHGFTLK